MICITLNNQKSFCIDNNDDMIIKDETDWKNPPIIINLGKATEFHMDAIIGNINRLRYHCIEEPDNDR